MMIAIIGTGGAGGYFRGNLPEQAMMLLFLQEENILR